MEITISALISSKDSLYTWKRCNSSYKICNRNKAESWQCWKDRRSKSLPFQNNACCTYNPQSLFHLHHSSTALYILPNLTKTLGMPVFELVLPILYFGMNDGTLLPIFSNFRKPCQQKPHPTKIYMLGIIFPKLKLHFQF